MFYPIRTWLCQAVGFLSLLHMLRFQNEEVKLSVHAEIVLNPQRHAFQRLRGCVPGSQAFSKHI